MRVRKVVKITEMRGAFRARKATKAATHPGEDHARDSRIYYPIVMMMRKQRHQITMLRVILVEQVILFGEIANAVVDPDAGLVDVINDNERMVEGYHIDLSTADEYEEKYRAMVVPSSLCRKGIAGRGTELIAWNDPPEHVDIVTLNGYVLARAQVGSFKNVGAYTVSGEVDIVYHNFMSIPYGTTVIPINQVEDEGHAVSFHFSEKTP